jgi:DNA-binding response OmpR family regulator
MKRILIVDDEEEIRKLVAATLPKIHCEVLWAASGEDAVKIAKQDKPDLIMMDINMPGTIDGLQATRLIKGDAATKNCFIIMLTSFGADVDKQRGFDAGADDYFVKPFSPLELLRKIDEILG